MRDAGHKKTNVIEESMSSIIPGEQESPQFDCRFDENPINPLQKRQKPQIKSVRGVSFKNPHRYEVIIGDKVIATGLTSDEALDLAKNLIVGGEQNNKTLILSSTPKPSGSCNCGCSEVVSVLCDNNIQYASWRCTQCQQFRGWIPKPATLTAQETENALIEKLLASGRLNDWEYGFCQSLKENRKRSPKQRDKLHAIANRYLPPTGCRSN